VELCEEKLPTFFISSAAEIVSADTICHYDFLNHEHLTTKNYIPAKPVVDIILTSGASCPDSIVDEVLQKILSYFPKGKDVKTVIQELETVAR
jgi:4-hydroxy-3-methylbut-2-en-1-yl diphosphate reductase